MDFKDTIEMLAEKSGIPLPVSSSKEDAQKQLLKEKIYEINEKAAEFYHEAIYKSTSKPAQEYVKKRKLDNKTLKAFLLRI